MNDALAQTVEQRPHAVEHRRIAAGHDGQRGVDGALLTAGNGRIKKMNAFFAKLFSDMPRRIGRNGRAIDQHRTGRQALNQAILAERNAFDVGTRGDHREHQLAATPQFGRRSADTERQVANAFRATRPYGQFMASPVQMQRHRAPHGTEADEA